MPYLSIFFLVDLFSNSSRLPSYLLATFSFAPRHKFALPSFYFFPFGQPSYVFYSFFCDFDFFSRLFDLLLNFISKYSALAIIHSFYLQSFSFLFSSLLAFFASIFSSLFLSIFSFLLASYLPCLIMHRFVFK